VPSAAESFPRVAELVISDQDSRQRSRKRYASYRDQGHEISTHNV
jgi:DNA polymerase IIIc chi subunit